MTASPSVVPPTGVRAQLAGRAFLAPWRLVTTAGGAALLVGPRTERLDALEPPAALPLFGCAVSDDLRVALRTALAPSQPGRR